MFVKLVIYVILEKTTWVGITCVRSITLINNKMCLNKTVTCFNEKCNFIHPYKPGRSISEKILSKEYTKSVLNVLDLILDYL